MGKLIYINYCSICDEAVHPCYWDGFWNNWEGAARQGGAGTTCYAPSEGSIPIDEGTYTQIRDSIEANLGFYWKYGDDDGDTCPHLAGP